jgi:hypothetical protein
MSGETIRHSGPASFVIEHTILPAAKPRQEFWQKLDFPADRGRSETRDCDFRTCRVANDVRILPPPGGENSHARQHAPREGEAFSVKLIAR